MGRVPYQLGEHHVAGVCRSVIPAVPYMSCTQRDSVLSAAPTPENAPDVYIGPSYNNSSYLS